MSGIAAMSTSPPRSDHPDQPAAAVAAADPTPAPAAEAAAPANGTEASASASSPAVPAAAPSVPAPAPVSDPAAERRLAENATAIPGADGKLVIPTKLFVGALSNGVDDARLRACFEPFGTIVECKVQRDKFTQQSRNFGSQDKSTMADAKGAAEPATTPAESSLCSVVLCCVVWCGVVWCCVVLCCLCAVLWCSLMPLALLL